jgi:hypothetical protein
VDPAGGAPAANSGRLAKEHWGLQVLNLLEDITSRCRDQARQVSRFDFGGQLREEGHIAVEFLRQTTDYYPGGHHLAVDHPKQFYRGPCPA